MFQSLRFRLPAFFLAGIVLAGLISTVIAVTLFQDYVRDRTIVELRREAAGLTELYADQALRASDEARPAPFAQAQRLERATGDRLFWVGLDIFPGTSFGLRRLEEQQIPVEWRSGRVHTFEFVPPDSDVTYLAVSHPLRLEGSRPFGALIVAKPKDELRERFETLMIRLAIGLLGGIAVAGALAWYLSRRIIEPVQALARAADQVAEGRYDVAVPEVRGGGEVGQLAERFREMAERLQEANELERNFLMTVSHELRTPLTAIRGHVEALREGLADNPAARAASLDVISAEASRLERLVGDVLDLAKLDAHRFTVLREEVDMGRLIDRAYSFFGEEARRRRIDYRRRTDAKPVIVSDGDRLLQVISNLLSNAFRWTPDGGRIDLELRSENGTVSVAVSDTGPGISAEERERIFRPFWTRDGQGTGLGLAIARELALALGGRIELDSRPGSGSRFEFVLPANPP